MHCQSLLNIYSFLKNGLKALKMSFQYSQCCLLISQAILMLQENEYSLCVIYEKGNNGPRNSNRGSTGITSTQQREGPSRSSREGTQTVPIAVPSEGAFPAINEPISSHYTEELKELDDILRKDDVDEDSLMKADVDEYFDSLVRCIEGNDAAEASNSRDVCSSSGWNAEEDDNSKYGWFG